jgi:hypothetical protein
MTHREIIQSTSPSVMTIRMVDEPNGARPVPGLAKAFEGSLEGHGELAV